MKVILKEFSAVSEGNLAAGILVKSPNRLTKRVAPNDHAISSDAVTLTELRTSLAGVFEPGLWVFLRGVLKVKLLETLLNVFGADITSLDELPTTERRECGMLCVPLSAPYCEIVKFNGESGNHHGQLLLVSYKYCSFYLSKFSVSFVTA